MAVNTIRWLVVIGLLVVGWSAVAVWFFRERRKK